MERRLLLSTVAIALALGSGVASAQTQRPSDQNQQAAPPSTQAQPPQGQMRRNPQPGGAAQNQPNAPAQNAAPQAPAAPTATTGQAAPQSQQPNAPNNQAQQPGPAQTQPAPQQGAVQPGGAQQGAAQQGQAQPGQAQPGMAQQPGNAAATANTGAGGANGNANTNTNAPNTNAPQNATANAPQGNPQGVITLNQQQNTRVSVAIRQANVRPLTNVSFSIAVGTTIPADVQVHVLPPVLVQIVPQYRDYNFVVVEQEALIIDPNSRAIVAVIPFEAQQTTGANTAPAPAPAQAAAPPPPPERKKLDLTRDQREIQRRQAERHRKADTDKHVIIEEKRTTTGAGHREPRVGDRVPDSEVIEGRPVEVYRDGPPVRDDGPRPSLRDIPLFGPLFGPPHDD